jgi:hypothetical protein
MQSQENFNRRFAARIAAINASEASVRNSRSELLMVRSCSLGEISSALYEVGGQYRRSM